jgi:large subunit ribosomal protein L25
MDMKEKIEAEVPLELIGEVAVVKGGDADLIVIADRVVVSSLPANIPEKIVVDLTSLKEVGDEVKIKNLPKGKTYEFVDNPEKTVIQISEAQKEEVVPEIVTEGEEPETEAAEAKSEAVDQKAE